MKGLNKMADKLDLLIDRIQDMKDANNTRLDSIDENLREHMRRTEILEVRVDDLEEPKKALKWIKGCALWVGAILGVTWTIIRLVEYIK